MSLPQVTWVWGYILILSWCLKVAVAGCSTPRDIWGDIAPYFRKKFIAICLKRHCFKFSHFFASQMGIKRKGGVATWTLNEKKTWFVNNQRNQGVGGLTVKCQEGDVRNLDLTHTSYLWLFLPKFSFPHNSNIISFCTLYTIFPNKQNTKLKQCHKLLVIGLKSNHGID